MIPPLTFLGFARFLFWCVIFGLGSGFGRWLVSKVFK